MRCLDPLLSCVLGTLRTRREGFDYTYHDRVSPGLTGLYAFWLDDGACLYVGKSTNISNRLRRHKTREDNDRLKQWFNSFPFDIQVSYIGKSGEPGNEIASLEERAIHVLRPLTNVLLQPK